MNKSLSPQAMMALASLLVMAAAIGLSLYFEFAVAAVPAQEPVRNSLPIGILDTDLKPGGVFDKTKGLVGGAPSASTTTDTPAPYAPGDLGKTDITRYN